MKHYGIETIQDVANRFKEMISEDDNILLSPSNYHSEVIATLNDEFDLPLEFLTKLVDVLFLSDHI